jgi:hypothetical protein
MTVSSIRPSTSLPVPAIIALMLLLGACSSDEPAAPVIEDLEDSVSVRIDPQPETMRVGDSLQFRAIVEDTKDTSVTWRLLFGSPGTITSDGLYHAPETLDPVSRTVNIEAVVKKFQTIKATHRFTLVQ